MFKDLKNILQYREMLKTNVKKDIRGKYKGSFLGVIWTFINPLLQLFVYALVFGFLVQDPDKQPYAMFIFVALIPWTFFTTALTAGSVSIVENANLVKKVYFPREILVLSTTTSAFVNFLLSMIIVFAGIILTRPEIMGINLLYFVLIASIEYILVLGLSFILSAITVYMRDMLHILGVFLMMLMYMSGVLFDLSTMSNVPENIKQILSLNPMLHIISGYRQVLFYGEAPRMKYLLLIFGISLVVLVLGYVLFKKLEKRFAEEL